MSEHPDRGAAAVEFALIALMLVMLVFGLFEGGRLWLLQSTLSAAARDGAREMAIHNDAGAAGIYVEDRLAVIVGPTDTLTVTVSPSCTPGDRAEVSATLATQTMTGILDFAIPGGNITLSGKGAMRCNG